MALEGSEWGAVAGVFVIVLTMMVYNQMAGRRTQARIDPVSSGSVDVNNHLSRFVVHDGDVIGEVVARDGDDLIVKHQGTFRAIPVASTRVANDEVHVQGDLPADAAERGAAWLAANRKGTDDAVTTQLTKSEDVKRPAFSSFQDRKQEARGASEEE